MYPRGKVLLYISREDTKERNNNQGRNEENRRRVDQSPRLMTYRAETEFYGSGGGEILFATSRSIERKRRIRKGKDREFHSLEISARTYIYIYVYI